MTQMIFFRVSVPAEPEAGISGFTEQVSVQFDAGGWDSETLQTIADEMSKVLRVMLTENAGKVEYVYTEGL